MTYADNSIHNSEDAPQDGLTKREYFASMAMQGLMVQAISGRFNSNNPLINAERAKFAVDMADALIEALNKTK